METCLTPIDINGNLVLWLLNMQNWKVEMRVRTAFKLCAIEFSTTRGKKNGNWFFLLARRFIVSHNLSAKEILCVVHQRMFVLSFFVDLWSVCFQPITLSRLNFKIMISTSRKNGIILFLSKSIPFLLLTPYHDSFSFLCCSATIGDLSKYCCFS